MVPAKLVTLPDAGPRDDPAPVVVGHSARWVYALSIWVIIWSAVHLFIQRIAFPNDVVWLQYYAVNYEFGFIRRGLAGELVRPFPGSHYLTASYMLLWASIVVWLIAVGASMWLIVSKGVRSDRRMMLALLVAVLPFAISYATWSPHPELFGMAVLLALGIGLTRVRTPRSAAILSALCGMAMIVLALIHEAIPLELALGAILAIVVLSRGMTRAEQRRCAAVAVGPGIASTLLIGLLGRRDVAAQLCAQVPHQMVESPWALATNPHRAVDYLLGRFDSRTDYHDWVCEHVTPTFNGTVTDAVQSVVRWGLFPLLTAFALGLLYFVASTWMIRCFSGVPLRAFLGEFRGNLVLPLLAAALLVPLFVVAVDWTRWWILITFDVAIIYVLYAVARPEIEQPLSRRALIGFACVVVALAVLPTGAAINLGTSY